MRHRCDIPVALTNTRAASGYKQRQTATTHRKALRHDPWVVILALVAPDVVVSPLAS